MNNFQGWLNIYKPSGLTSFTVVKKIKKKFNLNQIGHGGTLDPLAEGILPIAIGKATKLIQFINKDKKEYEFEIKWGTQTTTDDSEGDVIDSSNKIPNLLEIKKALEEFQGEILQKPPNVSSVKVNGERAYKLFREKKNFILKEKKVTIYSSRVVNFTDNLTTRFSIRCGKGFYIRSFARDIAEKLQTKAHITSLKRTKVGKFNIKNANLLDDLLKIRQTLFEFKGFHNSISMLDDILAFEIECEKNIKSISQGKSIQVKLGKFTNPSLNSSDGKIIFLTEKGNVISFGKLIGDLFEPHKVLI